MIDQPPSSSNDFKSAFYQICPDQVKAHELDVKSRRMYVLVNLFKQAKASTQEIASSCKISEERAIELMEQKFSKFTADELENIYFTVVPVISSSKLFDYIADFVELKKVFEKVGNFGLVEGLFQLGEKEFVFFISGVFKDGRQERFVFGLDPLDYTTPGSENWKRFIEDDIRMLKTYPTSSLSAPDCFKYLPLLRIAFSDRLIDEHVFDPQNEVVTTYNAYNIRS